MGKMSTLTPILTVVAQIFAAAKKLKPCSFELTRYATSSTIIGFYLVSVECWEVIFYIDTQSLSSMPHAILILLVVYLSK